MIFGSYDSASAVLSVSRDEEARGDLLLGASDGVRAWLSPSVRGGGSLLLGEGDWLQAGADASTLARASLLFGEEDALSGEVQGSVWARASLSVGVSDRLGAGVFAEVGARGSLTLGPEDEMGSELWVVPDEYLVGRQAGRPSIGRPGDAGRRFNLPGPGLRVSDQDVEVSAGPSTEGP